MLGMLSLYFMFYNFARVHQTLRGTPAMEAKTMGPDGKEKAPLSVNNFTMIA